MNRLLAAPLAVVVSLAAAPAVAAPAASLLSHQAPLELNEASSAWILTSTALVLMMTLPGLALFYGGMVRRKNVIATLAHSTAAFAIVTVLWFAAGYSLSFGSSGAATNGFIGGLEAVFHDSLDAFGVHGIGGIVGALLTGVFATAAINPAGEGANVLNQLIGLAAVVAWSGVGTFLILMVCKFTTGLRVAKDEEIEGLDYTQHGETLHP